MYSARTFPNAVAYSPVDVRAAFIRRVYNLFFTAILMTVAVGAFCAQPAVAPGMLGMWPVFAIGGVVCVIAMSFTRRAAPINLALMYLFAALQGAMLGPILVLINQTHPGVPADAAWITTAVFGALSMYAIQTRKDFNYLGGFLLVSLVGLIVAGIVMMFVHAALLTTVYCLFGILIFSGYVLYDTSRILLRLSPDEAVFGAVSLYLDLLNLFMLILQLLDDRR